MMLFSFYMFSSGPNNSNVDFC